MSAPFSRARAITSSPAHTRVSLLARAMRLPASMAARVGRSPAMPTTAVTTVSARGRTAASSRACSPPAHPGGGVRQAHAQVGGGPLVHRRHQLRPEFPGLLLRQLHAALYRQGGHPVAAGLSHLQGLPADGTGGAQNGNGTLHLPLPLIRKRAGTAPGRAPPGRRRSCCQTGPACPRGRGADGRSPFTPNWRLMKEKTRSPSSVASAPSSPHRARER